ncbi:group II intron maturase-specific domain-containing protein [Cryomorpha ignava]|uniref:group II intron maturase-specific domain-containing protein n=1 Tax=Cryomorpha ignava TaxID=101383 RepID=UPI0021D336C3|nr:group II intron maturase-specific domain-containing protein [Cryomorpha ignava]
MDKDVRFARYAYDVIIHCKSKAHAELILKQTHQRMGSVGLELHPDKTKIVNLAKAISRSEASNCRDYRRKAKHQAVKFDFLGYSFQLRSTISKKNGKMFLGFDCAISISSRKRIADKLEELNVNTLSFKSIVGVAQYLNPIIRGWVHYYGKFKMYELTRVFRMLSARLVRWARRRYERYKNSIKRAYKWLTTMRKQFPTLFYHWQFSEINVVA